MSYMSNPVALHDQALAYIKNDAIFVHIDGQLSYEILAAAFEGYWRQQISREIDRTFIDMGKEISSDWFQASLRTKMACVAIAKKGPPNDFDQ